MKKYLISAFACGLFALAPTSAAAQNSGSTCCSSIFFIPGVEASRLYETGNSGTSQLWEPYPTTNVSDLYLDQNGASKPGISALGEVTSAFNIVPVYQKVLQMFYSLLRQHTVDSSRLFYYDWRQSPDTAAQDPYDLSNAVGSIENLASTSMTGKVSIIAHSYGGLVAKEIYNSLRDKGEAGLIDKMVFVDVPSLGTPEAVASLLHGDDQEMGAGLLFSASEARQLAENMPAAYDLLPSKKYFSLMDAPIITFASSTMAGIDFSKYGSSISTYASLKAFIDDRTHGGISSSPALPIVGNASLFPAAEDIHAALDSWKPASTTEIFSVAGWGLPTATGISYFTKTVCPFVVVKITCGSELSHDKITTRAGDGTVVASSSLSIRSATNQIFDLYAFNRDNGTHLSHFDMLEADPVLYTAFDDAFGEGSIPEPYISSTPPEDQIPDDLTISVHSPADINIYDVSGNHTGPITNATGRDDFTMYETNIPGSSYSAGGDGETVTLPWKPDYTVDVDGTGIGSVMVTTNIQNNSADASVASSSFDAISVTPATHMQFATDPSSDESHSYNIIQIDEDGDGVYDATSTPTSTPAISAADYWNSLESVIRALGLDPKLQVKLLNRLDKAFALIQGDRTGKAEKILERLESMHIPHIRPKKITDADRTALQNLVQNMLDALGV